MHDDNITRNYLSILGDTEFERLVLSYLENTRPELRGIASTGQNDEGKPVTCPVDGIYYAPGPPPQCVAVASTTISREKLRGKWLGSGFEIGDVAKAAAEIGKWRVSQPSLPAQLYLATNRHLGGDTKLYRDALQTANTMGVLAEIVEASALLRYLDHSPEGQYDRQVFLGIPARRMGLDLLRSICKQSLDHHWQRFGAIEIPFENAIQRQASAELEAVISSRKSLVGVVGMSGSGKSVLAHQVMQMCVADGYCPLWISAEWISPDLPLTTVITTALRAYVPSLDDTAGESALQIASAQTRGLVLLVDDINQSGNARRVMSTVEAWCSRSNSSNTTPAGEAVTVLAPLWPSTLAYSVSSAHASQSSSAWTTVALGTFDTQERTTFAISRSGADSQHWNAIVNALGGDPLLCGVASPSIQIAGHGSRARLVRRVFEDLRNRAARETVACAYNANFTITEEDVFEAIDGLIYTTLSLDTPELAWAVLRSVIGQRGADILIHLARIPLLGSRELLEGQSIWRWKHGRIRDALIGNWLARALSDNDLEIATLLETTLKHPGLSEAWALTLCFLNDEGSRTKLVTQLAEDAPLALACALRLGILPVETELRRKIADSLRLTLAKAGKRHSEFVPSPVSEILTQLLNTDDELILEITEELPDAWDVWFARLRNGDVETAIKLLSRRLERGNFQPSSKFKQLEDQLTALGRRYSGMEEHLVNRLELMLEDERTLGPALLLMGYLGWEQFSGVICASWCNRQTAPSVEAGTNLWRCYLWALGRCCDDMGKPVLETMLLMVGQLSNEHDDKLHSRERYLKFGQYMGCVSNPSRTLSQAAAEVWASVATEHEDIATDLFYTCRHIERVCIIEAYVRWHSRGNHWGLSETFRNSDVLLDTQPLGDSLGRDVLIMRSRQCLDRLWEFLQEPDEAVRKTAFNIWRRSASTSHLSELRSIQPDDPLFDMALEVRVRLGDESAAAALVDRIQSKPDEWCGFAPRLCHLSIVREAFLTNYIAALRSHWFEHGHAIRHLPVDMIVELIARLGTQLLQFRQTWMSLWQTGVPEAFKFVQKALNQASESDMELLFMSAFWTGAHITRPMLEALRPVLHRIQDQDMHYLIEHAVASGQSDWLALNLPEHVHAANHSRAWVTESDMLVGLDALTAHIFEGYEAIMRSNAYWDVIRADRPPRWFKDPYSVMKEWTGEAPTDAKISVAGLALVERGTGRDLDWWIAIKPTDRPVPVVWEYTRRLLQIRKWQA